MKSPASRSASESSTVDDRFKLSRLERARIQAVAAQVGVSPREALRCILRNALGFGFAPGGKHEKLMDACNALG